MDIQQWYVVTVGDDSENQVALRSGVVQRTLNRQLAAGRLSPETVVAVARAYGRDVLDALVTVGLITAQDIRNHGVRQALIDATDREIAELVYERLARGDDHPEFEDSPPLRLVPDAADHPTHDAGPEGGGL